MNFGLTPSQHQFLVQMLKPIMEEFSAKIYIFGSRARGNHHPLSDIDVLIETDNTKLVDMKNALALLREKFSNSNFPFLVDLVLETDLATFYAEKIHQEKINFI